MAVYTLDQALEILFDDKEYYLSLSKTAKEKIRKYRQRHKKNMLTVDTKLSIVKQYGGEVVSDIKIKL